MPNRQIRAVRTERSITVYQAYDAAIAGPAVAAQRFVAPFKRERMTWIEPSYLWMTHRCGYATEPAQERVPAIEPARDGFEWALEHSCLSHGDGRPGWARRVRRSPVRIQWDPERGWGMRRRRSGLLPVELPYPVTDELTETIGASVE
ncbi:DUF4291 family protein [Nonomuraea sp. NPDC049709]|uniref:DUF4291 family protein n=1 Tax=Nonomuraea sp. NPDC049709 TaxID=3154736 RepID=UPI00342C1914